MRAQFYGGARIPVARDYFLLAGLHRQETYIFTYLHRESKIRLSVLHDNNVGFPI